MALKPICATLFLFDPGLSVHAAGMIPDAGTIMQQINPVLPQSPSTTLPGITIKQANGDKMPPTLPFKVNRITIEGNTLIDTAALHALVAASEGKELTLAELNELATQITEYYHQHNYPLARALIPPQDIVEGVVRFGVIEARYGKINLNYELSGVSGVLLTKTLSSLKTNQPIEQTKLDYSLLLLSDIPGVISNATLKPGADAGTSDLDVQVTDGKHVNGNISMDNNGNRYTGRTHAGGTVNFINPLRHGDVLTASGMTSGQNMNYGRVSYETLVNGSGLRVGGAYSDMGYKLGDTLVAIKGHGTAKVSSLWGKYPLLRSQAMSLYGQLQYDSKKLSDHIDSTSLRTDRHLNNWVATLSGDKRNAFHLDGIDTWNVSLTAGKLGFDDVAAQLANSTTAKTQGYFSKLNVNVTHLQPLSQTNSLYLNVASQWARGNLDSTEKMVAGGPYSVRSYDTGAISGDTGYMCVAELRHNMGAFGNGELQSIVFLESEHVIVNQNPWTKGENTATLNDIGFGYNWAGQSLWTAKGNVSTYLGVPSALVTMPTRYRAWVEVGKGF
jgi:hemolysin activation/secretion protein